MSTINCESFVVILVIFNHVYLLCLVIINYDAAIHPQEL